MKILFLGGNLAFELANWLIHIGEDVYYTDKQIEYKFVTGYNPDLIISYNYHYILSSEIVVAFPMQIINLHISYLPWNRGSHPNVWSFLDNTPKGVTIHYIDEGIDTGDIIVQKELKFDEQKETLNTTYATLHNEIQDLFKQNWIEIKTQKIQPLKQQGIGSFHLKKDSEIFLELIKECLWDAKISKLKDLYQQKNHELIYY